MISRKFWWYRGKRWTAYYVGREFVAITLGELDLSEAS